MLNNYQPLNNPFTKIPSFIVNSQRFEKSYKQKLLLLFFNLYFIDYAITVFPIFLLYSPSTLPPQPSSIPPP